MNNVNFLSMKEDVLRPSQEELEKFGITYFSYGLISQGYVLSSYFTNEEWGKLYKEKHYDKTDPLLCGVIRSNLPLIVWDALHPFGEAQKVMLQRNEICKIRSGLTIGIRNNENREIIALGADISPKEFYSLLKEEKYINHIYRIISQFYIRHKENLPLTH